MLQGYEDRRPYSTVILIVQAALRSIPKAAVQAAAFLQISWTHSENRNDKASLTLQSFHPPHQRRVALHMLGATPL